jgi:hypothetical protein
MVAIATDYRITIVGLRTDPGIAFGPTDSVSADSVLLTAENLKTIGMYPAQQGLDWGVQLYVYATVSTVETLQDLTGYTFVGSYWDPVTKAATSLTVSNGGISGYIQFNFDSDDTLTAGMYQFAIEETSGEDDSFICSGWLEIVPARPTA